MPSFRTVLIKTYFCSTLLDGLSCLVAVLLRHVEFVHITWDKIVVWICNFRTAVPVILAQILFQFQMPSSDMLYVTINETASIPAVSEYISNIFSDVYILSALLVLDVLLITMAQQHSNLRLRKVGARIRIACCSLIYRKVSIKPPNNPLCNSRMEITN